MQIKKYLKDLKIEPVKEIDIRDKCYLANKVAILLVDNFSEYDLNYLKIVDLVQHTDMYYANIPSTLSPVNYSYIDGTMYISCDTDLSINNEYLLHEVIHKIQEYRNKRKRLLQLGLCDILETKVKALAINEAAIQYIVHKILESKVENIEVYGIQIPTCSKKYYPILTNLIEQIAFVLGEKRLIDSTLNSNQEFKYNAIDTLGEENYLKIENNFDKILEAKNSFIKLKNDDEINENMNIIKKIYIETQGIILKSYFNREFKKIKNISELEKFRDKLLKYRDYIGSKEGQVIYSDYYKDMEEQLKTLEYSMTNKALIVVSDNKIINAFRKIRNYIERLVFQH